MVKRDSAAHMMGSWGIMDCIAGTKHLFLGKENPVHKEGCLIPSSHSMAGTR
jgi:hypothetical protein